VNPPMRCTRRAREHDIAREQVASRTKLHREGRRKNPTKCLAGEVDESEI
jgi:hypothetical protein